MNYSMKEIVLNTRVKAEEVLDKCNDLFKEYGMLTVGEVYVACNMMSAPKDHKYGWVTKEQMNRIELKFEGDGRWVLNFPNPIPLDEPAPKIEPVKMVNGLPMKSGPKPWGVDDDSMVDHPSHYQSETGLEAIDVIEAFTFDLKGIEAFCTGNALKYLCRWKGKNGKADLKKARWYINKLIAHIEKLEKENE